MVLLFETTSNRSRAAVVFDYDIVECQFRCGDFDFGACSGWGAVDTEELATLFAVREPRLLNDLHDAREVIELAVFA